MKWGRGNINIKLVFDELFVLFCLFWMTWRVTPPILPDTYITHNASYPLGDITEGNSSDNMQLPLEPHKALY